MDLDRPVAMQVANQVDRAQRYDTTTVRLHWISAGIVMTLWALGQTIDYFPRGAPRVSARSAHILLGASFAMLLIWRIQWRLRRGAKLSQASHGALGAAAKYGHWILYLAMIVTVTLGMANTWIRGDNIAGLFRIPSLAPGDKELRALVEDIHGTSANVLLILAAGHALIALIHRFGLRDQVLQRMLPRE